MPIASYAGRDANPQTVIYSSAKIDRSIGDSDLGGAGLGGEQPVLLSGRLSRRSKNVIRPVIDLAAPSGFLPLPPSAGTQIVVEGPGGTRCLC